MEYKDLKFSIGSIDDESGVFDGYASVFGVVDSYGDIVDAGAFKKSIKEKKYFPMLYSHDTMQPIGIAYVEEDAKGLKLTRGELNLDVERARETRSLMKQGAIKGISFGFETVKDLRDNDNYRHLKEVKLWEVSPCVFQANPKSLVGNVKSIADLQALLDQILTMDLKAMVPEQRELAVKAIERIQALLKDEPPSGTRSIQEPSLEPLIAAVKQISEQFKI